MAFVNEVVSEADKEKLKAFHFKNPVTKEIVSPIYWTIDHQRDVYLFGLGGQGYYDSEIPSFYALVWKGKRIYLRTFSKGKGNYQSGVEMWWKIAGISIPESLEPQKEEVIELIKEAIDAHGSAYRRDHVTKVKFDLVEWPVFYKEVK